MKALTNNWRRSAKRELRQIGLRWTQTERQAQEREQWKKNVDDLSSTQEPRDYMTERASNKNKILSLASFYIHRIVYIAS